MKPKNLFLTLVAMLLVVSAAAQSRKQVQEYYYWVNQAELAICDENYQLASQNYVKAFETANPFTSDLFAYFWIYRKFGIGEKDDLIFCAHKLAQREALSLDRYQDDTLLYPIFKNILDTTVSTIDHNLTDRLKQIVERDQEVRLRDDYASAEERALTVRQTDSINLLDIKKLYNTYPIINNDNAGFFEQDIWLILLHCSQNGIKGIPWKLFEEQVALNCFSVTDFMTMYDECTQWRAYADSITCTGYGTKLEHQRIVGNTLFVYPPANIEEINRNREKIGAAETWQDYMRKLVYTFLSRKFAFVALQEDVWGDDAANERAAEKGRNEIDSGTVKGEYFIR